MLNGVRFIAIILLAVLSQQPAAAAGKLTIAVASNVKFAFDDIAHAFTRKSGIGIERVFGSSGKIVAQVRAGAPYDVFLSADMSYPQQLHAEGLTRNPPRIYAYGKLVLWTQVQAAGSAQGLRMLTQGRVTRLAIANPKLSPYGAQALRALQQLGLGDALAGRLVYAENIAQVVQYVDSGNVDAGITAKSLVVTEKLRSRGRWAELPQDAYQPIAQGAVILNHGTLHQASAARLFYDFLYSPEAGNILAGYGYGLP